MKLEKEELEKRIMDIIANLKSLPYLSLKFNRIQRSMGSITFVFFCTTSSP